MRIYGPRVCGLRGTVGGLTDVVVEAQPDPGTSDPLRAVDATGGAGEVESEGVSGRLACGRVFGQGLQDHVRDGLGHARGRCGGGIEMMLVQGG